MSEPVLLGISGLRKKMPLSRSDPKSLPKHEGTALTMHSSMIYNTTIRSVSWHSRLDVGDVGLELRSVCREITGGEGFGFHGKVRGQAQAFLRPGRRNSG